MGARGGSLRRLAIVGGVLLLAGWLLVELVAPGMAEGWIEVRVRNESAGATGVDAGVDSFPLLTGVVLTGRVRRVDVTLTEVVRQRVTFASFEFLFEGIEVDRATFLTRDAEIRSIDRGTVTARIAVDELSAIFGVAQRVGPEGLEVDVVDGLLRIGLPGLPVADVDLPDVFFPCEPSARIDPDGILLSCAFEEVPAILAGGRPEALDWTAPGRGVEG